MPPPLPEDVFMDILSRLPANSLLRFKSVSKTWLSVITSPRFISTHLSNNLSKPKKNHSSLLILRSIPNQQHFHYSDSKISLSFLSNQTTPIDLSPPDPLHGEIQLFGPCNGIVCLTDLSNIVLSNPSIREFKLLPPPPFSYPRNLQSLTEGIGFGFDPSVSDYKVVKISQLYNDDEGFYDFDSVRVEIYSLSTDSWRESEVSVPLHVQYLPCFELWFNGAFHFYGNNGNDFESILAFDMSEEVFNQISFPGTCFYADGKYRSLGVLNDKLALVLYDPEENEKQFDIWVMNEYGVKESWTQLFSVGPLEGIAWPLGFWKDSEFFLEKNSGQLVSYNLDSREVKEYEIHGNPRSLRVLPYTESLISINRGDFLGGTV